MNLCLLAGALTIPLMTGQATLAWTHSVEKQVWEEDWRASPEGLVIDEARVTGSGAGMEAGMGARLENGVWRWKPALPPVPSVTMRRSGATADYRLCRAGRCQPLADLVPKDADPVTLKACE
jgi:hypothetical protein